MSNTIYKMRKSEQNGRLSYSLTVPPEIGDRLNGNHLFQISVNEDGILFTPVENSGNTELAEQLDKTSWAKA